jgi:hypothetical protein
MNKQFLIGGVIGGVLVWLLVKKKCPKCESGGGGQRGSVIPAVVVQTPPPPPPPPPPAPPPAETKSLPVLDKPVMGQTSLAFTGKWGQWVK